MSSSKNLEKEYDLLSEKIHHLRMALAIETDAAVKFKLEKQIEEAEAERTRIEQQLEGAEKLSITCPYRGLFAFREQDAEFFFGREAYTEQLDKAVQNKPFIAVIGASGSGKSSVVYAGLFPQLRRQGNWLITSFRPGDNPFQALSKVLIPFLYTDELDRISKAKQLTEQLHNGEIAVSDVIEGILEKDAKAEKFLLFVDQFEELYTLCREENERRQFLDKLLPILPIPPSPKPLIFSLVLTMRADFWGKAISYRPFADVLQNVTLILCSMNREELRETIENPAKMLGVDIEEGLTDRILDTVSSEPGNLPLLEFALTELWKRQHSEMLTHTAYDEIGGVERALTSYAESIYESLDTEEKERAKHIFVQLVRPGEGTEDIRRVAHCADVGEENWELVTKLADARLVVTGSASVSLAEQTQTGTFAVHQEESVEVVHEAMIKGWQRLREWVDADREFRTWQERLRAAMHQWITSNHDEGALLQGTPLAEAEQWLEQRRNDLSQEEQYFIEASLEFRNKEIAEREVQRQRELEMAKELTRADERAKTVRSRFVFALIIAVLSILATIGTFYGFKQAQEQAKLAEEKTELANQQKEIAQQERDYGMRTQSLFLADLARQQWGTGNTTNAILLALKALPKDMSKPDRIYVPETEIHLYNAVVRSRERYILEGHQDPVYHAVWSPDGQRMVSASVDRTARVWDATSGKLLSVLGHEDAVWHAAFSPDGQRVLTASGDDTARVWDATSGKQLAVLTGHEDSVYHAVWSPDGQRVLTASGDATARVWDATSGKQLAVLTGHEDSVYHAAWSPDGQRVLTISDDGTVWVWPIFPSTQALIDYARETVARKELTPEQRKQFFLE